MSAPTTIRKLMVLGHPSMFSATGDRYPDLPDIGRQLGTGLSSKAVCAGPPGSFSHLGQA